MQHEFPAPCVGTGSDRKAWQSSVCSVIPTPIRVTVHAWCRMRGLFPDHGAHFSSTAPQLRPKRGWPCSTSFPRHVVVFTNPRDHTQGFRTAPIWMCCNQKPPRGAALPTPHFGAADPNFSCPELSPNRGWPCSTSFPRHVVVFTNPRDHTQGFRTAPIWMCCDQNSPRGGRGCCTAFWSR